MRYSRFGSAIWLQLIGLYLLVALPAGAQGAVAQSLFDEGKRLMAQGDIEAACAKFEASEAAEPNTGALLNLANCHKRLGKTATAWAEFKKAVSRARADGREDRVAFAQEQAKQLQGTISHLKIVAPSSVSAIDDLEIWIDTTKLPPSSLGVKLPIDPGVHKIRLEAPGYHPWTTTLTIVGARVSQTVEVPTLRVRQQLSSITVTSKRQVKGVRIELDGKRLLKGQLGVPQELPPGEHVVTASARGYDEWSRTVELNAPGENLLVRIPKLQKAGTSSGTSVKGGDTSVSTVTGLILGGVGIGAVALGVVAGVVAHNQAQNALDRDDLCPSFKCTPAGRDHIDAAEKNALIATVLVPAGGLVTLVGVGFLAFGGNDEHASSHWEAQVGHNGVGLSYGGKF